MDQVQFPPSVSNMSDENSIGIKAIEKTSWPSELKTLTISEYNPPLPDLKLPAKLKTLTLKNQTLPKFARQSLPDSLQTLIFDETVVDSVYGVFWPPGLSTIDFGNVPIKSFEVRQSDIEVFTSVKKLNGVTSQSSCSQPTASLQSVGGLYLCVIPDDLVETLYGIPKTISETWFLREEPQDDMADTTSNSHAFVISSMPDNSRDGTNLVIIGPRSAGRTATPEFPSTTAAVRDEEQTRRRQLTQIGLSAAVVVVFALMCLGLRAFRLSKRSEETETHSGTNTSSDGTSTSSYSLLTKATKKRKVSKANSAHFGIESDVRKDKTMYPFFIEFSEIELGEVIAAGGYGVVYRATFQHPIVAVKQLLPDSWRDEQTITGFMDEIRLCAKLDHPRILEFHGITWTTQRNLSIVVEFMCGGDLHSVLQRHPHPSPRDWLDKWSSANLKRKAAIAYDTSEALAYLHSFRSPIIHRDLKARNILLDRVGNTKLSGFAISREVQVDKTMAAEVGTSACIAPEVLRGERYSEKVDIYSFGVLLVEMDRCAHPFEEVLRSLVLPNSSGAFQNAHFIKGVSTGELRPTVSSGCPESIRAIAERCVDFDPGSRPSATELSFALRQFTYRKP